MKKPKIWTQKAVIELLSIMENKVAGYPPLMSEMIIHDFGNDAFLILISCLLSLRSRDSVTYIVSKKLFEVARTPQDIIALSAEQLEQILKPLGFFRRKSAILKQVSQELIEHFGGKTPNTREGLLSINHVGPKTASLVLSLAFHNPTICVDTHVHRITKHLGLVQTKTPEQTEKALEQIIPQAWWLRINHIFVLWGQYVCKPNTKACVCWQQLAD